MSRWIDRIAASTAAFATLLASGVLAAGMALIPEPARAAEPKPAYATARLVKTADGTGHGTPAQTFVTSANGFTPGDDTPDDGVVSSGDTVSYDLNLSFTAAAKRQVRVAWDLSDAPYLEAGDAVAGFCTSGRLVSAQRDGNACVYTVPAGTVETISQKLTLTARDTGGVAMGGQQPKLTVSREGETGSETAYPTAPVTVVSAPAADLVADNGGYPDKPYGAWERRSSWLDTGRIDGYVDLTVKPLTYPGHTTSHGASVTGPWSADLDVSRFPQGTTFTMGGRTLNATNGIIHVGPLTGDRRLDWSIPANADGIKDMKDGQVRMFDLRVNPTGSPFAVDGEHALRNLGDGSEPGMDMGRDQTTASKDTGAHAGYPYANNDWTRAIIQRYTTPTPGAPAVFDKTLERPYTPGRTLFDPESLNFADSSSSQTIVHYLGDDTSGDTVAQGAQTRTTLTMIAGNVTPKTGTRPTVSDAWDPAGQQWSGSLTVTQGGKPLDANAWTVESTADDPKNADAVWTPGVPKDDDHKIRAIRVSFDPTKTAFGTGAGVLRVSFLTRVVADTSHGNVKVDDTMTGVYETDNSRMTTTIDDWVWAIRPSDPSAAITIRVTVADPDGNPRKEDALPGDVADYTVDLTVRGIQRSGTAMTPTVRIPWPAGLVEPTDTDGRWRLAIQGTGRDRTLVFTLDTTDGKTIPDLNANGVADLPAITWRATVGNRAAGTVSAAATLGVDVDANGVVPAHRNVMSNTDTARFTVSDQSAESGVLTADRGKVEIGDPASYSFNLYAKGVGRTGVADTVIHAPSNDDAKLLGRDDGGLDDSWHEYDRGSSHYHGTWALTTPVSIDADNSTATTILYSTTVAWSDDPKDYQWKPWDQLTDTEKTSISAIRVSSTFETADDGTMPVAAASGHVTIHPTGNTRDDQYNWWPGRTRFSDGHAMGNLPWADRVNAVAGSITGTVWWDRDENATIGKDEERIGGVTVSLYRAGKDGKPVGDPLASTPTGKDGGYRFDMLHSGDYATVVKRNGGTTTGDGVQTKVTTYYHRDKPVVNTYSWDWRLKGRAGDVSDRIGLAVGQTVGRVDFGYAKPDPKATLDKTRTGLDCDAVECTVNWDVKVANAGKTTGRLPNGVTVETLSAGNSHSLAIGSDGNTYAWGQNYYGQLGDDTTVDKSTPVKVKTPEGVTFTQVSAGDSHSLAVGSDGNVYAWGWNGYGQLGDDTTDDKHTPVKVKTPEGVTFTQVSAGSEHSLAVGSDGSTYAWGSNNSGRLGDDTIVDKSVPVKVKTPESVTFTQVSAGGIHSLAIGSDGNVYAWGSNSDGQLGDDTTDERYTPVKVKTPQGVTFTRISAGYDHSLAIGSDGNVYAWGRNEYGQLGDGTTTDKLTPVKVKIQEGVTFTQVSAGNYLSLTIGSDGNTYAWGLNDLGQLGDGTTDERHTPVKVKTPQGVTFTQVSAGYHSFAIGSDGNAYAWGSNDLGQLGDGTTDEKHIPVKTLMPVSVQSGVHIPTDDSPESTGTSTFPQSSTLTDRMSGLVTNVKASVGTVSRTADQTVRFKEISAGESHSLAIDDQGQTWAWGDGRKGQLGNDSAIIQDAPVKVTMPKGVTFTQISAGYNHSLALDDKGQAWAWGYGDNGELGNGNNVGQSTPVKVTMPEGVTFTRISAGVNYSLALDDRGQAWAWGFGIGGLLGNGDPDNNQLAPVKITMPEGVTFTQISAGQVHSLALDDQGQAWAWGYGNNGELGNGNTVRQLTPVKVTMPTGVVLTQVDAGYSHSLALDNKGQAWAWGDGIEGQLGNNAISDQLTPVKVTMPDGVTFTRISAGFNHSLALGSDNNTYAWGNNFEGQLGDKTHDNEDIPVKTKTPEGVTFTQISAGGSYSLAFGSDNNVYSWGSDDTGARGDGPYSRDNSTPMKISMPTTPGVSVDPTAVPIDPASTSTVGGDVIRTYHLPYEVRPGGYVVYHFTGTVKRAQADRTVHNQAWFDSPDTPYAGTPHARSAGVETPGEPDDAKLDTTTNDVTGVTSCATGSDYDKPGMEHWFSTGNEDSCDQVAAVIPAATTRQVLGSVSGLYWVDANGDGIRQDGETDRLAGRQVVLEDTSGNRVADTVTDVNGAYRFDGLRLGSYRVRFGRMPFQPFTTPDANDTNVSGDGSSTDSDAGVGDDYGMGTPTVTLTDTARDKRNVDAGVTPHETAAMLPMTGGVGLVVMIALAVLLATRRRRHGAHVGS